MIEAHRTEVDRFADETMAVVCRTLGAEWAVFYRLSDDLCPAAFRVRAAPADLGAAYSRRAMAELDPLAPARMVRRQRRFAMMRDTLADDPGRHRQYLAFLRSFGAEDSGEMVFRYRDKPVAGVSLAWLGRSPPPRALHEQACALHSYIEFNLASQWGRLDAQCGRADAPSQAFALTEREREIVDVACRGYTNEQIARHFEIGVATVKTHLIHIFRKCGVTTRGELISRVLAGP